MNSPLRLSIPVAIGAALGLGAGALHAAAGQPHEHGVTHLEVVADGSTLAINLRGAGYHLVGFEHAPESAGQRAAWDDTRARIADAGALFIPNAAAGCRAENVRVDVPESGDAAASGGHDEHGDGHDHQEDDHHEGHDHGHGHDNGHEHGHDTRHKDHAGHGHGHDHDDHDHPGHDHHEQHDHDHDHSHGGMADWQASYRFTCDTPARLEYIDVGLFDVFPAHEEVRYQRLSDSGQSGGTLTPGNNRLRMR